MEPVLLTWQEMLRDAVRLFLEENNGDKEHSADTPRRVVQSFSYMIDGNRQDPEEILGTTFTANHDQMVIRKNIRVVSTCEHHLLPFIGKAHFAYIPDGRIVGISKIPRLIRCFARRLQVQERLTDQIVDTFQEIIRPRGCALVVQAYHMCEIVRGAEEPASLTETEALRGCFKEGKAREEFFTAINRKEVVFP